MMQVNGLKSIEKMFQICGMNAIIEENKEAIKNLCDKYFVDSIYLFGSANTERFNDKSDFDFLISFNDKLELLDYADNFFGFQFALENLLGRRVDLLEEKCLSNPYLAEEIEETKLLIYGQKNKKTAV